MQRYALTALAVVLACLGCRSRKHDRPAQIPASVDTGTQNGLVNRIAVSDGHVQSRLLEGIYPGNDDWRWTAQNFAVSLDPPASRQKTFLVMDLNVPAELMTDSRPVTLTGKVNGVVVGSTEYRTNGRTLFTWEVPSQALETKPARVEFSLDRSTQRPDGKPQGIIVVSVEFQIDEPVTVNPEKAAEAARKGYQKLLADRNRVLPVEKQTEMMKLFHAIPVWSQTWFLNVPIEKNPLDLWMMQQIIYETQPDFIIETGTWHGGSALYWASVLNTVGLENSRVITVDIQNAADLASANPLWKKYVKFIQGSSTDATVLATIQNLARGHKVLVTLDSDHTMQHVLAELHAYAPLVSPGSYLVVEDTHLDGVPTQPEFGPGPMAAVRAFLAEPAGKDFAPDLTREAMIMTFNPGGWLRRK